MIPIVLMVNQLPLENTLAKRSLIQLVTTLEGDTPPSEDGWTCAFFKVR